MNTVLSLLMSVSSIVLIKLRAGYMNNRSDRLNTSRLITSLGFELLERTRLCIPFGGLLKRVCELNRVLSSSTSRRSSFLGSLKMLKISKRFFTIILESLSIFFRTMHCTLLNLPFPLAKKYFDKFSTLSHVLQNLVENS